MAEIEIYSAVLCPFAHRSRLTALEKGVSFQAGPYWLGSEFSLVDYNWPRTLGITGSALLTLIMLMLAFSPA